MEATNLVVSAGRQLGKWLVEEATFLYGVSDKVEELQKELEWIQCFLRSAEEKKHGDELVRKWIAEINDFSYEAEDIIEKYLFEVSHLRNDGFWSRLKCMTCALGDLRARHEVGCEIDLLTSRISKLSSRMITYGVTPTSLSIPMSSIMPQSKESDLRHTYSHLPVDDVVGFERDKTILVHQLMNKGTKVIGINGMAGSGKTTLARKVFQEVKGRQFEKCAWVYVSQKFQARDVIQRILVNLYADDVKQRNNIIQNNTQDSLEEELHKLLKQQKCLVVLDDIWTLKDWKCLENAFPSTASSSKLLITTRYKDLLSHIDPRGFSHPLTNQSLEHNEKMDLFSKKAFPDNNSNSTDPEMRWLGEIMVTQCAVPLEVVMLAGLLAPKKTVEEWRSVHKKVMGNKRMEVTDILELSYTNLPYHLRPCFLHLGHFPQGYEIPVKKLYRMWIAEGIVAPGDDDDEDMLAMNLEDTAESYLHELVQRSVVQVNTAGRMRSCRLHDLMWDMCTTKAKEENFLDVVRRENVNAGYSTYLAKRTGSLHRLAIHIGQSTKPPQINESSHDLSSDSVDQSWHQRMIKGLAIIHFGQGVQSTSPPQLNKTSHLRSLMFFSNDPIEQGWLRAIIKDSKLLRVLDLENTGINEDLSEVGNLIHLRYLSIKGTQVRSMPSSIGNLRCLETLDLRVSYPEECMMKIPNVLWKMKRLKYLYLPSHAYQVKCFQKLRIAGLSNLEVLKNFDTRISQVTNLRKLENLKKLSIKNNVSKVETLEIIKKCPSIKNNSLRMYLKIHAAILDEKFEILSNCSYLRTLEIEGSTSAMTDLRLQSVKLPGTLKNLAIKNCKLNCTDPMQHIKLLPNLISLTLDNVSFLLENSMNCSDCEFPQLIDLTLNNMETFPNWNVRGKAMPKLHRLQIDNCKNLSIPEGLPTSVHIVCKPCVQGIEKYYTCPHQELDLVDDGNDDLATRFCNKKHS